MKGAAAGAELSPGSWFLGQIPDWQEALSRGSRADVRPWAAGGLSLLQVFLHDPHPTHTRHHRDEYPPHMPDPRLVCPLCPWGWTNTRSPDTTSSVHLES